jgi:CheY-like chemotaxis protein
MVRLRQMRRRRIDFAFDSKRQIASAVWRSMKGRSFPRFTKPDFSTHTEGQVNSASESLEVSRDVPPRWMIVDDNEGVLQVLSVLLSAVGSANISCFSSGAQALAAFQEEPAAFQLVFTDLEMPGMNGFELCHRLRAVAPGLKIVLATGNCSAVDEQTAEQTGFAGLLLKPFSMDDLVQLLERIGALESARLAGAASCAEGS